MLPKKKSSKRKSNKSSKRKSNNSNKSSKNTVLKITIPGWSKRVRTNNLIKIVKNAYKKGIKKIIAIDEIDYQQHATYDVDTLMTKINNNDTENLLTLYEPWYKFW